MPGGPKPDKYYSIEWKVLKSEEVIPADSRLCLLQNPQGEKYLTRSNHLIFELNAGEECVRFTFRDPFKNMSDSYMLQHFTYGPRGGEIFPLSLDEARDEIIQSFSSIK